MIEDLEVLLGIRSELIILPLAIISGYLMKSKELKSKTDRAVYILFSLLAAITTPNFIISNNFLKISSNAIDFLTFICAVFGGLIILNIWKIVSNQEVWFRLVERVIGIVQQSKSKDGSSSDYEIVIQKKEKKE